MKQLALVEPTTTRRPRRAGGAGAVLAAVLVACAGCPGKHAEHKPDPNGSGSAGSGSGTAATTELPVLPPAPPVPTPPAALPPLPTTAPQITPAQVALGELLFFDPRLAADGKTACATCHDPDHDWSGTGGQPMAGGKLNLRRALALTDVAWRTPLAWDGRYPTLEGLLIQHFRGQLADDPSRAIGRIAALPLYRAHFARAFGGAPDGGHMLTALAAFARTRYSGATPWDDAEQGVTPTPAKAGTPETRGYLVFTGKAQCAQCHVPPLYTDQDFHRLGLIASPDEGRGAIEPTRRGAFRTPTLRGAARRGAFFHDGSATTLDAAIDWHLAGGTGQGADKSIVDLPAVTLTPAERTDLGAFLRALSAAPPPYPRPLLPQ